MPKALCLTGGGIKGAFQAGVLSAMMDEDKDSFFEYINGVSVGALNTSLLVDALYWGHSYSGAVDELVSVWLRKINRPSDLVRFRGVLNLALDLANGRWRGLLDVGPLEKLVEQYVDSSYPAYNMVKAEVLTVNMDTGLQEYFEPADLAWRDAVLASAMEPATMPIRTIRGSRYTDGGLRDVAGVKRAIALGYDHVTVIGCQPADPGQWTGDSSLFSIAGRMMEIVTNEITANDVGTLTVYRPLEKINVDITKFTQADIRAMYEYGRECYRSGPTEVRTGE